MLFSSIQFRPEVKDMTRRTSVTALSCVLLAATVLQAPGLQEVPLMAKEAHPSFEVATVKPSDPKDNSTGFHTQGRRVFVENETVRNMLMAVYDLQPRQIAGQPDWVDSERFDVQGVPDQNGMPSWPQYQEMVRKLLADRFGLKFHRESREMTVYALKVAKGGPKLTPSNAGPEALDQTGNANMMRFRANSMPDFVRELDAMVDRPVVDETGLQGRFDFTLRWRPEGAPADDPNAAEPLFTAIPEQLGLRLEAAKAPAEVLVVDHIDRPTAD